VAPEPDFEAFVAASADELVRFAYLLCHDRGRSEDLAQEALLKAHRRWARVSGLDHPEAYVRRIVLNEFLGWRRRRISGEVVGLAHHELIDRDASAAVDDRDQAWRLMAGLPPRQRAVLVLRYYLDLPDEQVAVLLECAQPTVRSLAARALRSLQADARLAAYDVTARPASVEEGSS
jgi:RNA polymerase sigma-70 factor (sigma-E family)